MPVYQFKTDDGQILEKVFSMKDAPPIDTAVTINGKRCKRIVSTSMQARSEFSPYTSLTLPRGYPGCPTDSRGRSIVTSREHERAIAKEQGWI